MIFCMPGWLTGSEIRKIVKEDKIAYVKHNGLE